MRTRLTLWAALAAAAAGGCRLLDGCGPGRAGPGDRIPAPGVPTREAAGPGAIGPGNARIEFVGSSGRMSQTGWFERFAGRLDFPTDDPKDARVSVTVDVTSTATNIGLLTRHLKGDDFFAADRHPEATFTTDRVEPPAAAGGRHTLVGPLTFRGVTREVRVPAEFRVTADEVELTARLTIRQTEFGMAEGAKRTADEVPVTISARVRRR
jgi:polyisoprenoid-binding protein YceI